MQIAVIGAVECTAEEAAAAETIGYLIAGNREVLCCGGRGGVMEAACRGAKEGGGLCVGILPGTENGNPYLDVHVRTNLGHARNVVLVESADAVIAVGGSYGTLSEIALALKNEIPVFGYRTWEIEGVFSCRTPDEAVLMAVRAARLSPRSRSPPDAPAP
ncbi:MAG: TIGR00725 family protein [Methanomicrobiaceae archaeon]|nr:TIGR00725 family protein [Methanomicrobiaceae archaeon]